MYIFIYIVYYNIYTVNPLLSAHPLLSAPSNKPPPPPPPPGIAVTERKWYSYEQNMRVFYALHSDGFKDFFLYVFEII